MQSAFPGSANLAVGKAVQLNPAPNYGDIVDADDARQLVDGRVSTKEPMWYDTSAVGWMGETPVEITIDLGKDEPIRGLGVRMGAGISGVEWPAGIDIYVSVDGRQYSPVGDLLQLQSSPKPGAGYSATWLATDKLKTHGRYVKIVCTPFNRGTGAYIIMDEVEIYRGEEAWLKLELAGVDSPEHWTAELDKVAWRDALTTVPDAERPVAVRLIDGSSEPRQPAHLHQVSASADRVKFEFVGEAGRPRAMNWTGRLQSPVATDNCRYALLTFRSSGIRQTYEPRPIVTIQGTNSAGGANSYSLLDANMAPVDDQPHTVLRRLPEGLTVQQLNVQLITEYDNASLVIERLEFVNDIPDRFTTQVTGQAASTDGVTTIALDSLLNDSLDNWARQSLDKHETLMDGLRTLPGGVVLVSGAPFAVADGAQNLAAMPASVPSDEHVEFLREQVAVRYLEPASRHDTLSVDVDAKAYEAYLLLAVSAPPVQRRGGQRHMPMQLDDIESLTVELTYDQGNSETASPYSLADRASYMPARTVAAYAVAVDPTRTLKKITLHNRHYGPNFALAGLTLNTSADLIAPELATVAAPERTRQNAEPSVQPITLEHKDGRLTIRNRWYEYDFDLTNGFVISRISNRWNHESPITVGDNGGLRVRLGNDIYTGRSFKVDVVRVTHELAELKLTSTVRELPIEIKLVLSADDSPELVFSAETTNRGSQAISPELSLPAIADLVIGDVAQTRLFFPQYRAVETGDTMALRAPYGPEYPQQFMNIFSRSAGVGLVIRTNNTDQQMAHFALRKDDTGVSGGVWYPAAYNTLEPGQSRKHMPVILVAHTGDWRNAVALQREWINGWYTPVKSQDKDYLINAWEIACYRTSPAISWSDTRTPAFITPDRKEFLTDEIFAYEKQVRGHVPELIHFFNWTYNDTKKQNEYGVVGTPLAFEQVGGVEFFREGIDDIQNRHGVPVSLYTLPDRLRISAIPDQELAQKMVEISHYTVLDTDTSSGLRAAGQVDGIVYPAIGHPDWLRFFVDDLVNMQKETNCTMVYIDVFASWSHLKGYNGISPREVDMQVLKDLRAKLPDQVAIWSEYPVSDYASQWEDGALHYYFLTLNEEFARRYNDPRQQHKLHREFPVNIGRYLLPRYKFIGLPVYIEAGNQPSQVDAMFVNGEAIQEDTWRLHHSRIRERLNRAYVVKHDYNDCFNSLTPEPFVDTEVEGIVANAFPGSNRIAWTFYNGRLKTYAGPVITVPHQPGAVYRDAWNDVELKPVINDGMATLHLTIDPQMPGCIVQDWN